ncbi:hypothetical protein BaRGS_00033573 [Batillaria attramentaria]|uniref:Secreted protein n=1 Tax=Batillaria attramentaria TaxID=370345 RepID=A0ABD0JL32_9CAEN
MNLCKFLSRGLSTVLMVDCWSFVDIPTVKSAEHDMNNVPVYARFEPKGRCRDNTFLCSSKLQRVLLTGSRSPQFAGNSHGLRTEKFLWVRTNKRAGQTDGRGELGLDNSLLTPYSTANPSGSPTAISLYIYPLLIPLPLSYLTLVPCMT